MSIAERLLFGVLAIFLLAVAANFALLSGWTVEPPGSAALRRGLPTLALSAAFGVGGVPCALKALGRSAWSLWLILGLGFAVWRGVLLAGL